MRSLRLIVVSLLCGMLLNLGLWPYCCCGQGQSVPFDPSQFMRDPSQMFEQMFGPATPEEEAEWKEVDIPFKDEREFGQRQAREYAKHWQQQGIAITDKGADVAYLRDLVKTLHPYMANRKRYSNFSVFVIDSKSADARTFPGGILYFHRGLLEHCESEAALVSVVGHELSHLDRGHLLVPLKRAQVLQAKIGQNATDFNPRKWMQQMPSMVRTFADPFRPEDELQADYDGAAWAFQAGYDPREFAKLFARLSNQETEVKVPFATFFRTHPYNSDRMEATMRQYDEMRKADPSSKLYRGAKNLRMRTAKSRRQFPE